MNSVLTKTEVALISTGLLIVAAFRFLPTEPLRPVLQGEVAHEAVFNSIPAALERFHRDVERYPTEADGLGALLKAPLSIKDLWRSPYLESPSASNLPTDP